jgi:hypothetical protein
LGDAPAQLFVQDSPKHLLERLLCSDDVVLQCGVDPRLVVAATGGIDLGLEPIQHFVVRPDRDPCLAGRDRPHRPAATAGEVVLFSHFLVA